MATIYTIICQQRSYAIERNISANGVYLELRVIEYQLNLVALRSADILTTNFTWH